MARNPELKVIITGDVAGARGAVTEAEGLFTGMSNRVSGVATAVGTAVGNLAANAGTALIGVGVESINLAQQMETLSLKANTVFGDSVGEIRTWADSVNESFGMSDEAVVGLAANMGDLLVPLGFSREAAADMSKETINLAGALSAWSGGAVDAAQVSDILTAAYLGETDGLKQLGISLSADEVAKRAAQNAAEGLTFATEEQAQAFATQQLIMEKSTDAQTAWADGTMDATKKSNEMKAAWEDAKVALGEVLLPIVQRATSFIVDTMIPAFRRVAEVVAPAFEAVIDAVRGVVDFVRNNWQVVLGAVTGLGIAVLATLVPAFIGWAASAGAAAIATLAAAAPVIAIGAAIAALAAGIVYAYRNFDWFRNSVDAVASFLTDVLWPAIRTIATTAFGALRTAIETVWTWMQNLWDRTEGIRSFLVGAFNAGLTAVGVAFEVVRTAIETVWTWIQTAWDRTSSFRGFLVDIFNVALSAVGTAFGAVSTAIETVWTWIQTAWDRTELYRAFLVNIFNLGLAAVSGAFGAISTAISTVWGWIQTAWDRSELFRVFMAGAFKTAIDGISSAFNAVWSALSTVWGWLQDVWDRSEGLRAFFVDTFTAGINIAVGAINGIWGAISTVIGWIDDLIGTANTAIGVMTTLLGMGDPTHVGGGGGGAGGTIPKTPTSSSPTVPRSGAFATGTNFFPGGLALVGENGRELVEMPRGSRIYTNRQTESMLRGGGYVDNRQIHIHNPAGGASLIKQQLERWSEINYDL